MSSPSSTGQKEEEGGKMELGQVTEKSRELTGRRDADNRKRIPQGLGVSREKSWGEGLSHYFCFSSNVYLLVRLGATCGQEPYV